MSIEKPSFTISTLQEVSREVSFKPIVGFEKTDDLPDGWQFDIKRWSTLFDRRLPTLPRLSNPSYQGLDVEEYFKSGVSDTRLDDFNLLSIDQRDLNYKTSWIPSLRPGTYFRFNEEFSLFSDDSVIQYIDPDDNDSGRNVLLLSVKPSIDTRFSAVIYKRDDISKFPRKYLEANLVGEFSGIYSGGEELETIDDLGTINWSNIDTTKKEFIFDTSYTDKYYLRFNRDFTFQVGRTISSYSEIGVCEDIGTTTGEDYQVFYTKYFPIIPESIHVYVADETSSYTEWTQVDSFFELVNSVGSNEFYVDKDLGAICFGDGTNAPADGLHVMITYTVTMRVEYEPDDTDNILTAFDAELNPVNKAINQGFICITHDQPEAANINLIIDKSSIAGTSPVEYGPVYAGSDYAILRAEVTSISDVVVPNQEVTFTMTPSDLGAVAGGTDSEVLTNGSGFAFTSYQPPTSADNLGFYSRTVRASTHASYPSGYKDVIIFNQNASLDGKEEEVFLYQVLKDDLFLGYDDIESYIIANVTPPAWVPTPLNPTDDEFQTWKEELLLTYGWTEWEDPGSPDSGQTITGRKVVTYQIGGIDNVDVNAIDPADGSTGATVVPVKPVLVEKITDGGDPYYGYWRAIYDEDAVPAVTGNIAGYWLATSRLVSFKASCWSSYYNKTIESNEIVAKISPPSYMLGEYLFGGDKVPYGWKLLDEFNNIAAAINGITFITINPRVTPYQIIEIIGSGTTDDYASNQFSTKSFNFDIS